MQTKYRCYHKTEKKFYTVTALIFSNGGGVTVTDGDTHKNFTFEEIILLPFTGKATKNGLEIYLGDILKYGESQELVGHVYYDPDRLAWYIEEHSKPDSRTMLTEIDDKYITLVGNIYQNL